MVAICGQRGFAVRLQCPVHRGHRGHRAAIVGHARTRACFHRASAPRRTAAGLFARCAAPLVPPPPSPNAKPHQGHKQSYNINSYKCL